MNSNDGATLVFLGIYLVALAIGVAIAIFVLYLLFSWQKRVPAAHRAIEPVMIWLLLIPCVNLVWNFFVFQRIPISFKRYFDSVGDTSVGDCGEKLGLYYSIAVICCMIPLLNFLAGPASLILLIMFLLKINELKKKIPVDAV